MQLYGGIAATSVKLATDPTAEIDLYGGIRPTFGPVAFDFGGIYYWYPQRERSSAALQEFLPAAAIPLTRT